MPNFSNIPTGLKITSQIPLDYKKYAESESILSNLGSGNNLAFTYFDGLRVFCRYERSFWEWREVQPGEENTGLLSSDFTYPDNVIVNSVDYSLKTFNFFKIEFDYNAINIGSGEGVFYDLIDRVFQFKSISKGNSGSNGYDTLKEITSDSANVYIVGKKIDSNSLVITDNGSTINIEISASNEIPSMYVNNAYTPSYKEWYDAGGNSNPLFQYKGIGTLGKPFTDSINYTSPILYTKTNDTAIQNALNYFIGSGSLVSPEFIGQKIIVQKGNYDYSYNGNFSINGLNIEFNDVNVYCLLSSGYLIDMDNVSIFPNSQYSEIKINLNNKSKLYYNVSIRNSGTNVPSSSFIDSKILFIEGNGSLVNLSPYNSSFSMFELDKNNSNLFNNDGNLCISCNGINIYSENNCVLKCGGLSKIEFNKCSVQSSTLNGVINPSVCLIEQYGGLVRFLDCNITAQGNVLRNSVFKISPTSLANTGLSSYKPFFLMRKCRLTGYADNWFLKTNDYFDDVDIVNCESLYFSGNNLFDTSGSLDWLVNFRNNVLEQINIDFTKIDFTKNNSTSSTNTIGSNVIEQLVRYGSRFAASAAGLPVGSKFLNTNGMPTNSPDPSWKIDILI